MTIGTKLLLACLKGHDDKVLSEINKRWLEGDEIKQFTFLMDYYREHGELMGIRTFSHKFKLDIGEVDAKTSFYVEELKNRFIFTTLTYKVPIILKNLKESPKGGLTDLTELVSSLSTASINRSDTLYSDDVDKRKSSYTEREKSLGVTYLSMGIKELDEIFYGYREHDLITIGGKAGSGKTWLLCYLTYLLAKYLSDKGSSFGDILFVSNEMGEDEIKERFDCIRFHLPYKKFLQGTLSEREKSRYFKGLSDMTKSRIRILYNCYTLDDLVTQVGIYKPAIVFIDGSYLMEPNREEGWEKIVYLTRNLKRMAKNMRVPVINTTQLKRGSTKTSSKFALDGQDDFAYSSSYAQDSDIAIRMYQDADMKFHSVIGMEVVKGRRVESGTKLLFQNDLDNMNQSITKALEDEVPERKDDFGV